jgi:hypothetical protein
MRLNKILSLAAMTALPFAFTGCGEMATSPSYSTSPDAAMQTTFESPAEGSMSLRDPVSEAPSSPTFEVASAPQSLQMAAAEVLPAAAAPELYRSDLEDQDAACWGNRQASGYTPAACGDWGAIGSAGARLAEGQSSHSGLKSLAVTFSRNEEVAGASLPLNADVVNVRSYYNFAEGFDFGQGIKIGRVSSFNASTQVNDIDMVLEVRSAGAQCGLTDMADVGLFFNGKPVGHDWGSITSAMNFQRGRWYAIEYQVALNNPGASDGSVKVWVDGLLVASKTGINIRGSGGASTKLNRLRVGGWYSNSARGNGCSAPSQASTMFIDDVAVGTGDAGRQIGMN